MCGLAGFVDLSGTQLKDDGILRRMASVISHRGPDDEGIFISDNVGLAHRRLSIIDLSTGKQPMISPNQQCTIVFNGEIYNYIELRKELENKNYVFQTSSDTEVILHAYDCWGHDCQNKFNGMWAFALWDKRKGELFISRDRLGEKPLHYGVHDNCFVFSSEIKSFFAFGFPRQIREELIELYLSLTNIPAPDTFFKNIFKLMPGHYIVLRNNQFTEHKYWGLPLINEGDMLNDKNQVESHFSHLLEDSVRIRMRSDVPFGAFLSGGLDSSSIVSIMARVSAHPVKTFTIGFPQKEFDESELAQEVATKFKTDHELATVVPENFGEYLIRAVNHYDEPFGDSSAIPTDIVSRHAARKVKMVLTGDGGDEVLSGYHSYQGIKLANLLGKIPKGLRNAVPVLAEAMSPFVTGKLSYQMNKASNIVRTASLSFNERMSEKLPSIELETIKRLCQPLGTQKNLSDYISAVMNGCEFKNDFYRLMYLNFMHDLPNDFLVKVDRMSMANSLETRLPFLDYRLVEYMYGVDYRIKMQGWERKSVLRNTVGKTLPEKLLHAPKKGFGIPLREWFKGSEFNQQIEKSTSTVNHILDANTLKQVVTDNTNGKKDHGNFIWTLMVLNAVMEKR